MNRNFITHVVEHTSIYVVIALGQKLIGIKRWQFYRDSDLCSYFGLLHCVPGGMYRNVVSHTGVYASTLLTNSNKFAYMYMTTVL